MWWIMVERGEPLLSVVERGGSLWSVADQSWLSLVDWSGAR